MLVLAGGNNGNNGNNGQSSYTDPALPPTGEIISDKFGQAVRQTILKSRFGDKPKRRLLPARYLYIDFMACFCQ